MAMNLLEQQEFLEAMQEQPEQERERFRVHDLESANWVLRKMAVLRKKEEEIKALAKAEVERILAWEVKELEAIRQREEFFTNLLAEYLYEQRKHDPKFKISTPYGKVSTRKQPPKWEYPDDETLVKTLKEVGLGNLIRIKEEPDKAELKRIATVHEGKVISPDGAVIEGIRVVEQPEKIVVKLAEGGDD